MREIITIIETTLVEALAPPVKWRWTERKDFEFAATFKIGKVTYEVSIFRFDSTVDGWLFDFTAATKDEEFGYEVSNTGNAWKVFGTVADIAKRFVALKKPKLLKIENDPTERSRLAVNRRIASAVVQGTRYRMSVDGEDILIEVAP